LIAPWIGSAAPASTASVSQPLRSRRNASQRAALRLGADDQGGAGQHGQTPKGVRRTERLGLDTQPAEAVERQRGEHLAGDPEAHRDHRSQAWEEDDAGRDVDSTAEPADQMPRLRPVEPPERVERTRDRRRREQDGRADPQLQHRRAERAPGGRAELDVGGCLHRQQGADEEQEGNRERLHGWPPL